MSRWTNILAALETPGSIVITSHVNPDGDALGSELAAAAWLRRRGRTVHIINSDPPGARYQFLDPTRLCEPFDPARHDALLASAGVVLILDVARIDRLGRVGEALARCPAVTICIDHHVLEEEAPVDHALIDTAAAATGELIFELIHEAGSRIDAEMALALYVAIMTDTGSFRYGNTSPNTHRIAAELLRFPIDTAGIFESVYGTSSAARLRLMGEVLATMDVRADGQIILLTVARDAVRRCGATSADSEGFVELGRTLESCRAAVVLSEQEGDAFKVSLRSRGALDIGRVARKLGGGGHPQAAGAVLTGSLNDVRERVLAELVAALAAAAPGDG